MDSLISAYPALWVFLVDECIWKNSFSNNFETPLDDSSRTSGCCEEPATLWKHLWGPEKLDFRRRYEPQLREFWERRSLLDSRSEDSEFLNLVGSCGEGELGGF